MDAAMDTDLLHRTVMTSHSRHPFLNRACKSPSPGLLRSSPPLMVSSPARTIHPRRPLLVSPALSPPLGHRAVPSKTSCSVRRPNLQPVLVATSTAPLLLELLIGDESHQQDHLGRRPFVAHRRRPPSPLPGEVASS
ncbi:uncharacterized protein LOC119277512 [Triticum dicoccoides]|uniref:uncharacterized protein LOC119277512 n=1 Tax=Triticum dicoccoides TaxID=85692 RepID=UPI00188ECE6F|nr:uncharacterized protein LOC119277512 [Triticum dicoccoides]